MSNARATHPGGPGQHAKMSEDGATHPRPHLSALTPDASGNAPGSASGSASGRVSIYF